MNSAIIIVLYYYFQLPFDKYASTYHNFFLQYTLPQILSWHSSPFEYRHPHSQASIASLPQGPQDFQARREAPFYHLRQWRPLRRDQMRSPVSRRKKTLLSP